MNGAPEPPAMWTFTTLKEFLDAQLEAMQQQIDRRIETTQRELHDAAVHAETRNQATGDTCAASTADLGRRVEETRDRLTRHVEDQADQISAAVDSARREAAILQKASDDAVAKAEKATEKRFEAVNEFREQLRDQAGDFMLREVADRELTEIRKQIQSNTDRINQGLGSSDIVTKLIGWGLTALTVLIAVVVGANAIFGG